MYGDCTRGFIPVESWLYAPVAFCAIMYTNRSDILNIYILTCIYFLGDWESVGNYYIGIADCRQRWNVPYWDDANIFPIDSSVVAIYLLY